MPYIKDEYRKRIFNRENGTINLNAIREPGELNYAITELCIDFIDSSGKSYTTINAIIGVLEAAKLEMYRRVAAEYEDEKIISNGDLEGYKQ